jgi:hypothetical protein
MKMADVDIKIALDNPVETIQSDFNNFIHLGKPPSRQDRIEETSLSNRGGKKSGIGKKWKELLW